MVPVCMGFGVQGETHKMFFGLMIKHHRVQIIPVAVRARFCVRESFSAGRYISPIPAITIDHCFCQRCSDMWNVRPKVHLETGNSPWLLPIMPIANREAFE